MSLTLNDPVKKKLKLFNNSSIYYKKPPFPLAIGNESDRSLKDDLWFIITGRFNGLSVVVDDSEEMKNLHTMGFFGKGSLSKREPYFESFRKGPAIIRERQWERRKEWSKAVQMFLDDQKVSEKEFNVSEPDKKRQKLSNSDDEDGIISLKTENVSVSNEILIIADSDGEENFMTKLNPRIETHSKQTVIESLHLSLEEAFFLCYGLGCLQIIDLLGNLLPIATLWNIFRQTDPHFVENYVAFHYFRAKGWVVKSGMQFGGQFILYKKGPIFYHSTYVVIVEVYDSDGKRATKNDLSLFKLCNLNRLAEGSFKEVLICEVHRPETSEKEMSHPDVLPKFTVREMLMRRWLPNQERKSLDESSEI